MIAANVLGDAHVMMGIDVHNMWPPGSPAPAGIAPHGVVMILNGMNITVSKALKTKATYLTPIHQGSDIGNFIPHIQVNLLLPLIIAFSGSKSQFGVSTVSLEGKPIGVACAMYVNINMNCSDPVYTTTGIVPAMPMTVQAGFTFADFMGGLASTLFDVALSGLLNLAGNAAGKGFSAIGAKIAPHLGDT
ncbi:MAG: hypothetical protein AAF828_00710, partial [Bacteroidota bacterium]